MRQLGKMMCLYLKPAFLDLVCKAINEQLVSKMTRVTVHVLNINMGRTVRRGDVKSGSEDAKEMF